jgi:Replication-relaxation
MKTRDQQQREAISLSGIDDRFLQAIYRYHMLKPEQLTQRYYSRGSLTFVKARLKRLTDHGYLDANEQPTTRGRSPFFYTLASKGIKYLKEAGLGVNRYYRPSRKVEYLPFLLHTFSVNDVLIAAEWLAEDMPQLTLAEMLHELVLKQDPCKVPGGRERFSGERSISAKHSSIIPDGWLDFRYDCGTGTQERRMCIWLEVDRGTVGAKDFKEKATAILSFYKSGAYQKRFGTNSLRVAFATTDGMTRVKQMCAWLCDVLTKQQEKPGMAELFLCTALPDEIDPHTLFLTPVWYVPFDNTHLVSLLVTE